MKTVRELLEEYNITQTQAAERFGIPRRTVQGWACNMRTPPEYIVRMMEELLAYDAQKKSE